ncbi:murein hydrolase activator EnvC family protein [Agromyces mangrovi Wang et al. 2018]|uniref:murein hydrolase activator EnvC family protein n=1 Tax=Agromyces mangrovi TaxID=1858653 RepID=UPI0025745D7D|nr:M23 family metallopeptidase [Agromyces mangrovi]BDZ63206.1 hypothetical protein GCM10025877_01440 [Agromyces mangrovi]
MTASLPRPGRPGRPLRLALPAAAVALLACMLAPGVATASPASSVRDPLATTVSVQIASVVSPGAAWRWPVAAPISVVAGYRAGDTVYSAGHRGVDLAAREGDPVFAPDDGVVAFAGWVGDRTLVTVDHGDGVVSTLEPVVPSVAVGELVRAGDALGTRSTGGHCADCLHLGARVDMRYVSPLVFLGGVPRAVLLPLD